MKANYCSHTQVTEGFHNFQSVFSCRVKRGERKLLAFYLYKGTEQTCLPELTCFFSLCRSPLALHSCCIMSLSGLKRALAVCRLSYLWHFAAPEEESHFLFEEDIRIISYFLLIIFLSGAAGLQSCAASRLDTPSSLRRDVDVKAFCVGICWEVITSVGIKKPCRLRNPLVSPLQNYALPVWKHAAQ